MNLKEHVSLAPLTTLGVGGAARFFVEAETDADTHEAIVFARERALPLLVLGNGSNVLVPDAGVEGVVLKLKRSRVAFQQDGDDTLLIADAGAQWKEVVDAASRQNLFGIENLAGIPGMVGGAVVQNIGAYGAELSDVFVYADSIDARTGEQKRVAQVDAAFAYRTSLFKQQRNIIITRVALRLSRQKTPNLSYADLMRAQEAGVPLTTSADIASAICSIRENKFPVAKKEGTAGSFFKNPIVSRELADSLATRYSGLPLFQQENGAIKISLAWLLDHALGLKGYEQGKVRLYERQPLVLVARVGATAADVHAFADEITKRVYEAAGITIEREVETFGV